MARFKVLVVGSGGREDSGVEKFLEHPDVDVIVAPGSTGMRFNLNEDQISRLTLVPEIQATNIKGIVELAKQKKPDLCWPGPEAPLIRGLGNAMAAAKLCPVFGFEKIGGKLEGDKAFAKAIYQLLGQPTALATLVRSLKQGHEVLKRYEREGRLVVLKANGEAAGKGVRIVPLDHPDYWGEQHRELEQMMDSKGTLGFFAKSVLIEERYPVMREWSAMTMVGKKGWLLPLMPVADHKEFNGENTGGMGVVAPAKGFSLADMKKRQKVVLMVMRYLRRKYGVELCGILYEGLNRMGWIDYLVEINCRGGDPETQAQLEYLCGVAFHEIMLAACEGDKSILSLIKVPEDLNIVGVVFASKGYPGNYSEQKGREIIFPDKLPNGGKIIPAGFSWDGKVARITGGRVGMAMGLVKNSDRNQGCREARKIALEILHSIEHKGALVWREDIGVD